MASRLYRTTRPLYLQVICALDQLGIATVGTPTTLALVALYVTGLVLLDAHPTQTRVTRTLPGRCHDALNRLLRTMPWSTRSLMAGLIGWVTRSGMTGYLCLDDVVVEKAFAKRLPWAGWTYSFAKKRKVYGMQVVVLWCSIDGGWRIPVAFRLWRPKRSCAPAAYHYWPAFYFVDAGEQIRHHRFGEGDYEMSEMILQQLLTEAGSGTDQELTSVDADGVEAAADWASLRSPENYLGYQRTDNFVSPNGAILDTSYAYAAPTRLRLNHWALGGAWTVHAQATVLHQAGGRILYRFHARDLHLVMAPTTPGGPIRFRVHLDGQPPGAAHGTDIDDLGNGTVTDPRLYQLIRQPGPVSERTFEITFLDPGVQAYAFTFG